MKKMGIIGYGNMGRAIAEGILSSGIVLPKLLMVSDPVVDNSGEMKDNDIFIINDNKKVAEFSDMLILAVKPNILFSVIEEIKDFIKDETVIVSVAAGITINSIEGSFDKKVKVIRTMPNTAALVGEAMTAIAYNENVTKEDLEFACEIFKSFGNIEIIDEKLMDVVTAVSGSSPALVYMFIEALADGGVLKGLPRSYAYKMAAQAVLGAAKMILETEKHPGELKDNVCSPGGTTIEAVYTLEKNGFRGGIIEAVSCCVEKAKLLSQQGNVQKITKFKKDSLKGKKNKTLN